MRTLLILVLVVFWAMLLLFGMGCGSIVEVKQRGIWIEDSIPVESVMTACAAWEVVGVECVLAESRDRALVVVSDSHEVGCEKIGGVVWAGSGGRGLSGGSRDDSLYPQGGWVHMHMGCFPASEMMEPYFLDELSHEIGHALGCGHVPGGLMNASGGTRPLNTSDIEEYWRVN